VVSWGQSEAKQLCGIQECKNRAYKRRGLGRRVMGMGVREVWRGLSMLANGPRDCRVRTALEGGEETSDLRFPCGSEVAPDGGLGAWGCQCFLCISRMLRGRWGDVRLGHIISSWFL
jgi:hypothetical protein